MKKKVLYVFSLILYMLTACTVLSQWVEREMMTEVQIIERRPVSEKNLPTSVYAHALFTDEEGKHLYEVTEGTGWEDGLRFREVDPDLWTLYPYGSAPYLEITGGRVYQFAEYASRQPVSGRKAAVINSFSETEDRYLFVYEDKVPDIVLPEGASVIAQSENALLIQTEDAVSPFFEHRVQDIFGESAEGCRIFSLTEKESFQRQFPLVVLLAALVLLPVVLWLGSLQMVRDPVRYRTPLLVNGAVTVILLGCCLFLSGRIDLPASMMPPENIFDFGYYREEFALIETTLKNMGRP